MEEKSDINLAEKRIASQVRLDYEKQQRQEYEEKYGGLLIDPVIGKIQQEVRRDGIASGVYKPSPFTKTSCGYCNAEVFRFKDEYWTLQSEDVKDYHTCNQLQKKIIGELVRLDKSKSEKFWI